MKKLLGITLVAQIICSLLWLNHDAFLRNHYAENRFELSKSEGKKELIEQIKDKGGEIPEDISVYTDKERFLDLGSEFHNLIFYYPLLILQLVVICILCYAFTKWSKYSCLTK